MRDEFVASRTYSPSLPLDSNTYSGPTQTRGCDYSAKQAWTAAGHLRLGRPVLREEEPCSKVVEMNEQTIGEKLPLAFFIRTRQYR
jgi:hypothetical protein